MSRIFVGDFETTVYEGQTSTEVWASALVELNTENVILLHSIQETFEYLEALGNVTVYYHNLKFDGSFWLNWLILESGYQQALLTTEGGARYWMKPKDMPNGYYAYTISDMGQWYTITITTTKGTIKIIDSLKLLPFAVRKIGESFGTKHKKLEMDYSGYRYAGCEITDKEAQYIGNDVLVVKEALEIMYAEGHTKLTIGACCLAEFKKGFDSTDYKNFFPQVYDINVYNEYGIELEGYENYDKETFSVGNYVHGSYRGGWCYVQEGKTNKVYHNGTTADVNSLYPSMMSSESGNKFPVGKPMFWKGNYIPEEALQENKYFFIRIRTRFFLKKNKLPFIQIKHNIKYKSTEMLKTSDVYKDGELIDTEPVTMTMTMTDYKLFLEHYKVSDFQILDGCYFYATVGIFDNYIEKYKKIKLESTGARRELAKLFLNNLYGKMASSQNSSFKFVDNSEQGLHFMMQPENNKTAGYIPIGSAITSYARNFTIRAAQKNYKHFIYADTDSIHCDVTPDKLKDIPVHDKNFCCWKLETCWDSAIFVRQKTYIEHITHENQIPVEQIIDKKTGKPKKPYYNVKCAGMPDVCKDKFIAQLESKEAKLTDFKIDLKIEGKLMPRQILGGTLLVESSYQMR